MKPIRLGIIGCGGAAKELHLPALRKMPDKFEIVCLCNHTEPKAKELSQMLGSVHYVLDYRELLADSQIDAVDIALPINLNYQVTKDALQAGKHVIVEKPLAANLEEAEKMLCFEEEYPQVMMVAENFRYRPSYIKIKKHLDDSIVGKPYAIFIDAACHVTDDYYYAKTKWRIEHTHPGGFITDAGVHYIAGIRSLLGDIVEVRALTKCMNPAIGKMDSFSMQFRTADNVHGVFNENFSAVAYQDAKLLILAENGTIILKDNIVTVKTVNDTIAEKIETDNGYFEEFENFYNAITADEPIVSTFYQAYKDLEVLITAIENANQPCSVKIKKT